jgi:hypothetical protein
MLEAIRTEVMIRKNKGWMLVHGKQDFMGWLHTGTKGKFASKIFERNQQATWHGNKRLPVHALWGPSLVQLLHSPEVQKTLYNSKALQALAVKLKKEIKL